MGVGMAFGAWSGWLSLVAVIPLLGCASRADGAPLAMPDTVTMLDGSTTQTQDWDDKVLMFVNVASKCGFTTQYDGLQALYDRFKDDGLVIIGAPCNQFGSQEPGNGEEIQSFCRLNYGVNFPLLDKQDVNGDNRSPLYKYLLRRRTRVLWNFEKILVGRDGKVIDRYRSTTTPESVKLVRAVEKALAR